MCTRLLHFPLRLPHADPQTCTPYRLHPNTLTLSPHSHREALLQAAKRTSVPRLRRHRAVPGSPTRVLTAHAHAAPEETPASFAGEDAEVISTGVVATNLAQSTGGVVIFAVDFAAERVAC